MRTCAGTRQLLRNLGAERCLMPGSVIHELHAVDITYSGLYSVIQGGIAGKKGKYII